MNHTKNYNLPQWELNDLIRMEDFNSAMSNIENGVTSAAATADAAQNEAEQARFLAQKTALNAFTLENLPYQVGSYMGIEVEQDIVLGFRPSFLIVAWYQGSGGVPPCRIMVTDETLMDDRMTFTDTGFTVSASLTNSNPNPRINTEGVQYVFIAFK